LQPFRFSLSWIPVFGPFARVWCVLCLPSPIASGAELFSSCVSATSIPHDAFFRAVEQYNPSIPLLVTPTFRDHRVRAPVSVELSTTCPFLPLVCLPVFFFAFCTFCRFPREFRVWMARDQSTPHFPPLYRFLSRQARATVSRSTPPEKSGCARALVVRSSLYCHSSVESSYDERIQFSSLPTSR